MNNILLKMVKSLLKNDSETASKYLSEHLNIKEKFKLNENDIRVAKYTAPASWIKYLSKGNPTGLDKENLRACDRFKTAIGGRLINTKPAGTLEQHDASQYFGQPADCNYYFFEINKSEKNLEDSMFESAADSLGLYEDISPIKLMGNDVYVNEKNVGTISTNDAGDVVLKFSDGKRKVYEDLQKMYANLIDLFNVKVQENFNRFGIDDKNYEDSNRNSSEIRDDLESDLYDDSEFLNILKNDKPKMYRSLIALDDNALKQTLIDHNLYYSDELSDFDRNKLQKLVIRAYMLGYFS